MCGIVGVIAKYATGFYKQHEDSFFEMLYADALRGYDSTGVIGVEKDGSFHIAKEAAEATWVIPQIQAEKWFKENLSSSKSYGKAWIGHNRKTTVGKTSDENAHPFVVDKQFAFVHNGTLYNHEKLAKTDVDSKALAIVIHEAMGKPDYKTALEETLGNVFGAYATAWFDQRLNKVFLLRNKERPLCIVETQNAFYFASEGLMATWILARNGYKKEDIKYHEVPEHTLISFDLDKTEMVSEVLIPKKSTPPISINKGTGGTTSANTGTASTSNGGMSKSQLKQFRRRWLGQAIKFWVDDYVERHFPRTFDEGEVECIIMGENDDILLKHTVQGHVDISKLQLTPDMLDSMPWHGYVSEVTYDKRSGYVKIVVDGAKPLHASRRYSQRDQKINEVVKEYAAKGIVLAQSITPTGKIVLFDPDKKVVYESTVALH